MLIDFLKKSFENALMLGQTKVSDNQFNGRVNICKGCDYLGQVEPLPKLKFKEGCLKCSCPLVTKARLINHTILGVANCPLGKWAEIDSKFPINHK